MDNMLYNINAYLKKTYRIAIFLVLAFLIQACDQSSCVTSDSTKSTSDGTKEKTSSSYTVRADGNYNAQPVTTIQPNGVVETTGSTNTDPDVNNYGKWLDTGIQLDQNQDLTISVSGSVFMCPVIGTNENDGKGRKYIIDSRTFEWTGYSADSKPPILIHNGDYLQITIDPAQDGNPKNNPTIGRWLVINDSDDYPEWSSSNHEIDPSWGYSAVCKNKGWCVNGNRLFYRITSSNPNNNDSSIKNMDNAHQLNKDGSPVGTQSETGNLYFRILDTTNERSYYDDNVGGFVAYVINYGCPANDGGSVAYDSNIGKMQFLVSSGNPNDNSGTSSPLSYQDGQSIKSPIAGRLYAKIFDTSPTDYMDNSGYYQVDIDTYQIVGKFSESIQILFDMTKNTLYDDHTGVSKIFTNLTGREGGLSKIVSNLLLMYMAFYALFFATGISKKSQLDFVIKMMKYGIVLMLVYPDTYNFFKSYIFNIFIDGMSFLVQAMNTDLVQSDNPFSFADSTLGMIFSGSTNKKVFGLLFVLPFGFVYVVMIYYCFFTYVVAIFKAIIAYIMALMFVAMLVIVGPIFIMFAIADPNGPLGFLRSLFDNWLKYFARYTLEPAFLIAGLSTINQIFTPTLYKVLNYSVCWKCTLPVSIGFLGLSLPSDTLFCLNWFLPWGFENVGRGMPFGDLTVQFSDILMLGIFAKTIKGFVDLSGQIISRITNTQIMWGNLTGAGSISEEITSNIGDKIKGTVGMDKKSQQRRQQRRTAIKNLKNKNNSNDKNN